jgi:plastocyanin
MYVESRDVSSGRAGRGRVEGRVGAWLFLALAMGVLVAGCGDDDGGGAASGADGTIAPVQSGQVEIQAIDNAFRPEEATVVAGSDVVWTNRGRNDHNIIPIDDTPFRADVDVFGPGDEYRFTMDQPGTYRYYCSIHGSQDKGMIGTIQVVEG